MGGIGGVVLRQLIETVAEKNDYDKEFVERAQRGSVLFNNEYENINLENDDHF